jgi:DNA invertase Pin-like site-specific DNA recombinase
MYVAYYRVSTRKQGADGLGIEAQKTAVRTYAGENAILAEYTDVESGAKDNREQLQMAIHHCQKENAVLLIAKLDRLSRNVNFISALMDSKTKFVCCDMPEANEFTIHIFAAVAQQERKMISERVRLALHEKKLKVGEWRVGKIGNYQSLGVAKIKANAKANLNTLRAQIIAKNRNDKGWTLQAIADELNALEMKTARNKMFQKNTVRRLL